MKTLQKVWHDIRSGENIDLYLTVVVAASLATLNIFGVAPQSLLSPITLGVLALLAITSLGNRYRIERLVSAFSRSADSFFMEEFPPGVKNDFAEASETWLIGVSLSRTVKTYYSQIERKLGQGHTIRVLLVHPAGAGVEMAVSRNYARRDVALKSGDIHNTLQHLCDIRQNTPGKLEIRTIQSPLTYGAIVVDPNAASGALYLEHYCFRVSTESLPRFVLRASDGRWYDFFKKEMSTLWEAGVDWTCI